MEYLYKLFVGIFSKLLGYLSWKNQRFRDRADEFKELLTSDMPNYNSQETSLGTVVLSLYPKHDEEFRKLLIYTPQSKHEWLLELWGKYTDVYSFFRSAGVFGPVVAELPHPDFGHSPEGAQLVERKRKLQVVKVFNEIIEKL